MNNTTKKYFKFYISYFSYVLIYKKNITSGKR